MRKITIHQNDTKNIEVLDDSNEPIDEYCTRLSELMKMGNIAILKTSSASVVLRPSKVVGIKVEDSASSKIEDPLIIPPEEPTKAKPEESEDIITDV
jgi:hypothetical protein